MLPVIVIIGRPNVGKSSLFNFMTNSRDALVIDQPGVTRDRQYGEGQFESHPFIVIDTGGIGEDDTPVDQLTQSQASLAIQEADIILFIVDGRAGITAADQAINQQLRQIEKPIYLLVNKTDGLDETIAMADFYQLGLNTIYPISVTHRRGLHQVMTTLFENTPTITDENEKNTTGIQFAIIGRPNVGKSTLVNRILGEERVITLNQPGTTRDSIFIPFERHGKPYTVIDTAGVRRRGRIDDTIEKFSVVKTLKAISAANVVLVIFDAQTEISHQDLSLLGFAIDAGKAIVVAINKWDGLPLDQREWIRKTLDRKLAFLDFARIHMISALHGTGVGDLFRSIDEAYASACKTLSTRQINDALEIAIQKHQPPLVRGRRIKIRYGHMGGHNPPIIVLHGNQVDALPKSYQRYLINYFRKTFKLIGTPIRLQCQEGENPYKDRKNTLTERQTRKRKRLKKFLQRKK